MAAIFYYIRRFWFKCHKNEYTGVFEVADYDSNVENEILKIADPIRQPFLTKCDVSRLNWSFLTH